MEKIELKAQKREITGKKVVASRREGLMPAVVYGKGKESISLFLDKKEFDHAYKHAGGNTIVSLSIDGGAAKNILINDAAKDPVHGDFLHADFYLLRMDEKITASIPLNFTGDSKAVIELGGSLLTPKTEIEVECLPADLPHEIEVDISVLEEFESVIHLNSIKLPAGVELKDDPEETIAFVEPPRSEEELAELEEPVGEVEMPEAEKGTEEPAEETQEEKQE